MDFESKLNDRVKNLCSLKIYGTNMFSLKDSKASYNNSGIWYISLPKEGEPFIVLNEDLHPEYNDVCNDLKSQNIYYSEASCTYFIISNKIIKKLHERFVSDESFVSNLYVADLYIAKNSYRIFILPIRYPNDVSNQYAYSLKKAVESAKKTTIQKIKLDANRFSFKVSKSHIDQVWPHIEDFEKMMSEKLGLICVDNENNRVFEEMVKSIKN